MAIKIPDQKIRHLALDIKKSYIIGAPAGSGKTQLLITRFLTALLNIPQDPQQLLAITFTNKAAHEMRQRIISTLEQANNIAEGTSELQLLAQKVLARDKKMGWQLLQNPQQLNISTIDALSHKIISRVSTITNSNASYSITDNADFLYNEAIGELLHEYMGMPWQNDVLALLQHQNNNYTRLQELLIELLKSRDIWLPYVVTGDSSSKLRLYLEKNLAIRTSAIINYCQLEFNAICTDNLERLFNVYLASKNISYTFINEENLRKIDFWQELANFLLTKQGSLRKSVVKETGFLSPSHVKCKEEKAVLKVQKAEMKSYLDYLSDKDNFIQALQMIQISPGNSYSTAQWQTLQHIIKITPIAVSYLQLTFALHSCCDFVEKNIICSNVLGSTSSPSIEALDLSSSLHHIMIDEFQDTSLSQLELLKKLINTWEEQDNKTLFLVGDPMQSIYKFRQADVAIFNSLRNNKIGNIKLNYLQLCTNFRSNQTVVTWINEIFGKIFNTTTNINYGAVHFSKAIAASNITANPTEVIITKETIEQDKVIIAKITKLHAVGEYNIAILVRSRSHVMHLANSLTNAGIAIAATEMQHTREENTFIDIANLYLALIDYNDKTSWLNMLSAAYCGISLDTIYKISTYAKENELTIWHSALQYDKLLITENEKIRLTKIIAILHHALAIKDSLNAALWLEMTWLKMGGANLLQHDNIAHSVHNLFARLATRIEPIPTTWPKWQQLLESSYICNITSSEHSVKIMTIHKSKGLEFDHVILPSIERIAISNKSKLLNWHSDISNEGNIILSPIPRNLNDESNIHKYLKFIEKQQASNENMRVLYVAATRARTSITLVASKETEEKDISTTNNSFLAMLWPYIESSSNNTINFFTNSDNVIDMKNNNKHNKIMSLKTLAELSCHTNLELANLRNINTIDWSYDLKITQGVILHKCLEQIATKQLGLDMYNSNTYLQLITVMLTENGITMNKIDEIAQVISVKLTKCTKDPYFAWCFAKEHTAAENELALTKSCHSHTKMVIDRTFIDKDNTRWIIDYKTSAYDSEKDYSNYHKQLQQYAQLFISEKRKIMLSLYFIDNNKHYNWEYR